MTEQTAPTAQTVAKQRSAWKPLAAAGIGGAVLVATGFGVFAQLSATATNAPQEVNTGDLKLVMAADAATGGTSAGFATGINNMAPGDVANRFVSLTNTGSLDGLASSLKLKVTDTVGSLLSTDALHGLQLKVQECSVPWTAALSTANPTPFVGTPTAGALPSCTGGSTSTALVTNLAAFTGNGAAQTLTVKSTAAGAVNHLLVSLSLPDQNEVSLNGGTPSPVAANAAGGYTGISGAATSIQRLSAALTFTFSEFQRDAVASNS